MKKVIAVGLIACITLATIFAVADHQRDAWNYGRCGECGRTWHLKSIIEGSEYEYWCENGHAFTTNKFRGWVD